MSVHLHSNGSTFALRSDYSAKQVHDLLTQAHARTRAVDAVVEIQDEASRELLAGLTAPISLWLRLPLEAGGTVDLLITSALSAVVVDDNGNQLPFVSNRSIDETLVLNDHVV